MTSTRTTTTNAATISTRFAMAGLFCFASIQLFFSFIETQRSLQILYHADQYSYYSNAGLLSPPPIQQKQQEGPTSPGYNNDTSSSFLLETFAISFNPDQVANLQQRNEHANLGTVLWVNGADGKHQRTLDLWAQLTNHGHPPMTVEQANKLDKDDYGSPHAVGCYLAHWNLLRTLAHRPVELLQHLPKNKHAYLILEDDASCAPGLNQEIERTIEQLPSDWDVLFVGGKPFSYFDTSKNNENNTYPTKHGEQLIRDYLQQEAAQNWTATAEINQLIRQAACQGDYGKARGPLAPNDSRHLSEDINQQSYWRSDYLTNTHSYVVNPHRVTHVVQLLQPSQDVPIDIRLGDLMANGGQLNAYMTTRSWCDQRSPDVPPLLEPTSWQGFYVFKTLDTIYWKYLWQTQMHSDNENCVY